MLYTRTIGVLHLLRTEIFYEHVRPGHSVPHERAISHLSIFFEGSNGLQFVVYCGTHILFSYFHREGHVVIDSVTGIMIDGLST